MRVVVFRDDYCGMSRVPSPRSTAAAVFSSNGPGPCVWREAITAPATSPCIWKITMPRRSILPMSKLLFVMLACMTAASAADLPSKKYINLAAIKTMVAAAEAEAKKRNVEVTLCIVDESGNLLFLQKADAASLNTIVWAQKKARHAAFYRSPSKDAADNVKKGNVEALAFPDYFPNQGGLPIQVDGQTIGAIAASGAKSEIDEAIAQAAIDALFKK
jgi:glc operon protein GlcG